MPSLVSIGRLALLYPPFSHVVITYPRRPQHSNKLTSIPEGVFGSLTSLIILFLVRSLISLSVTQMSCIAALTPPPCCHPSRFGLTPSSISITAPCPSRSKKISSAASPLELSRASRAWTPCLLCVNARFYLRVTRPSESFCFRRPASPSPSVTHFITPTRPQFKNPTLTSIPEGAFTGLTNLKFLILVRDAPRTPLAVQFSPLCANAYRATLATIIASLPLPHHSPALSIPQPRTYLAVWKRANQHPRAGVCGPNKPAVPDSCA